MGRFLSSSSAMVIPSLSEHYNGYQSSDLATFSRRWRLHSEVWTRDDLWTINEASSFLNRLSNGFGPHVDEALRLIKVEGERERTRRRMCASQKNGSTLRHMSEVCHKFPMMSGAKFPRKCNHHSWRNSRRRPTKVYTSDERGDGLVSPQKYTIKTITVGPSLEVEKLCTYNVREGMGGGCSRCDGRTALSDTALISSSIFGCLQCIEFAFLTWLSLIIRPDDLRERKRKWGPTAQRKGWKPLQTQRAAVPL